jgi:hypothetical protein
MWISPLAAGSGALVSTSISCGTYFLPGILKYQVMADTYRHSCKFPEDFCTCDYFPQLLKYQDLQSISIRITGCLPEFSRQVTKF